MAKATTMKTLHNAPYSGGSNSKAPNYDINYDDKRFQKVESDKTAALDKNNETYDGMIADASGFYQDQINAAKDWEQKQTDIQNEQTDFAIEKIEQQKDQAKKDYTKEQAGAYADWQKQSNPYGANAEAMASQGLTNTGYSESSQVSMYNTYQQRVIAAREAYSRAVLNYDNAMKEARLQNSAALAQIAHESLQKQLELALAGFQYKNQLVLEKAKTNREIDNIYHSRWQDVLQQINTENTLAETVRQHNLSYDLQKRAIALDEAKFAYQKQQDAAKATVSKGGSSGGSSGGGSSKGSSSKGSSSVSKGNNSNASVKGDTKKEPTIDTKSVLALGYGPISGARLNELESQGIIKSYVQNGKIKFTKAKLGTAGVKGKTTMKNFGF